METAREKSRAPNAALFILFYPFANSTRSTCAIRHHMTQAAKLLINRRNTCELFTEDYLGHYIFPLK